MGKCCKLEINLDSEKTAMFDEAMDRYSAALLYFVKDENGNVTVSLIDNARIKDVID